MYPDYERISPELLELMNRPHKEEMTESEISWLLMEIDKEVVK